MRDVTIVILKNKVSHKVFSDKEKESCIILRILNLVRIVYVKQI